jgi:hypothetical protein
VTNLTGTASININGTVGVTTPNTGNFTVLTENGSPAVVQTDIGSAPNEIPLNQYLGNLAYQDAANIAGPVGVGGALTVAGALTVVGAASMASATVTNAVEAGGGVVAEQLVVDNFTAASSAVLRGGSTNLCLQSENFATTWTTIEASVTTNTVIAPDGTLTGDKLVENTATNPHLVQQVIAFTTGTTYSFSVYAKAAERTRINIQAATSATFGISAFFDLSNGTVISATLGSASIQSVGNGWYRCTATGVSTQTLSSNVRINLISTGTTSNYTGDGTSGVFLWGAQLNVGAVPAAYLQTVATAVTTAYAAPIESPNGLAFPLLATMTPARNADMTFELASNTSLVVKVRGSDGTVRSATLLLV